MRDLALDDLELKHRMLDLEHALERVLFESRKLSSAELETRSLDGHERR
jgi:hypothetical protein